MRLKALSMAVLTHFESCPSGMFSRKYEMLKKFSFSSLGQFTACLNFESNLNSYSIPLNFESSLRSCRVAPTSPIATLDGAFESLRLVPSKNIYIVGSLRYQRYATGTILNYSKC